jgi:hypothetical protein
MLFGINVKKVAAIENIWLQLSLKKGINAQPAEFRLAVEQRRSPWIA